MTTIRLYDAAGVRLIGTAELIPELVQRRPTLQFRNKLYAYTRHAFDGTVHYTQMIDPYNVDHTTTECV